jgi:hypothetical protein
LRLERAARSARKLVQGRQIELFKRSVETLLYLLALSHVSAPKALAASIAQSFGARK